MNRKKKKYFKYLYRKTWRELWTAEFNIDIVKGLVLEFSTKRLELLKTKLAKWQAKDPNKVKGGKKKHYDGTKKLEHEIKMEENMIKGAEMRIREHQEELKAVRGKIAFIKKKYL